jgi:hypothetical protein
MLTDQNKVLLQVFFTIQNTKLQKLLHSNQTCQDVVDPLLLVVR